MFIFTVLARGQRAIETSLVMSHPSNLAGNSMLALGVAGARQATLPSTDESAFQKQEALGIPIADHIHYVTARPEHGPALSLFQACYASPDSPLAQRQILMPLMQRTRSLVIFAKPELDVLPALLQPLLELLKDAKIPANQIAVTVIAPADENDGTVDQAQYVAGLMRRPISPNHYSICFEEDEQTACRFADVSPDLAWKLRDEFQSISFIAVSKDKVNPPESLSALYKLETEPWDQYVRLEPRQLITAARLEAHDSLIDLQSSYTRQMLVLTSLQQAALLGAESADRVAAIRIWNQVDRVIGTGWLLALLRDASPTIRAAAVDALCQRLPNPIDDLLEMALLDYASDVYGTAREVIIRSINTALLQRLVTALDDPLFPKRQGARKMLSKVGIKCLAQLRDRMRQEPYAGRVGAASVLASMGNRRAAKFLQSEYPRTGRSSHKRDLLHEAIEHWDPEMWNTLSSKEQEPVRKETPSATAKTSRRSITGFVSAVLQPRVLQTAAATEK
jgi:hypothetical protein